MNRKRINRNTAITIIIAALYTIYFYVVSKLIIENNMMIKINDITFSNLETKLIGDICVMLLVPLTLVVIYRKRLIELKLQFSHLGLEYILIATMVILFFLHRDFSIRGFYKFFFYLVLVAFGEELIFRGYFYNKLQEYDKVMAIIISGLFWGILHAVLPELLVDGGILKIGVRMLSEIGGGIIAGCYFVFIMEKSKSLFIPILIHAILDYTIGYIGIIMAIGTGMYLFILDRKNQKHI